MSSIIVASALLIAVIALLFIRGFGAADRSTIYAVSAVGVGVVLNITPLYGLVDGWLGARNIADLIANTSIILGMASLARGVVTAADGSLPLARIILGEWTPWVAVLLSIIAFSLIDIAGTSSQFMIDYGDQPAAAVYSGLQNLYFGLVTTSLAIICARQLGRARGFKRAAAGVLMVGSIIQTVSCADVIFMDIAHVLGEIQLMELGQWVYDFANSVGIVLMATGFVLLPIARFINEQRFRHRAESLAQELNPTWRRALDTQRSGPRADTTEEIGSILYRQAIEVRDAQASARNVFQLSAGEAALLGEAESLLLDADPTNA